MATSIRIGRFNLRPFDLKCREYVDDPDGIIEGQIRSRIPLWSGDFDEVIPELTAAGVGLDELPLLTVKMIGQYVIRAAQGGSIVAGPIGTAAHTITTTGPAVGTEAARLDEADAKVRARNRPEKVARFIVEIKRHGGTLGGYANTKDTWVAAFDEAGDPKAHDANTRPITEWLKGAEILEADTGSGLTLTALGKALADRFESEQRKQSKPVTRVAKTG